MVPVWQGFVGVHAWPAVQAVQVPPPQTWFVPQLVPSGVMGPDSVQTGNPLVQANAPARQGFVEGQASPCAHPAMNQLPDMSDPLRVMLMDP
jgi:hypothetical protein